MIDMAQFFPQESETGDMERRVIVLESLIVDLLRRVAAAEAIAGKVAQNLGSVRAQIGP